MPLQNESNFVLDVNTGDLLEWRYLVNGPDKEIWNKALSNDIGRLTQGAGTRMTKINNMFFMHPIKMPKHEKSTYFKLVATARPLKKE